jgi:hypothetical protein
MSGLGSAAGGFPATSRYALTEVTTWTAADGRQIPYLRRRFVPPPDRFALLEEHLVAGGDRLDRIADEYLGDPEAFWRICDANAAIRPDELTEVPGRRIRITLPEGVPGVNPLA